MDGLFPLLVLVLVIAGGVGLVSLIAYALRAGPPEPGRYALPPGPDATPDPAAPRGHAASPQRDSPDGELLEELAVVERRVVWLEQQGLLEAAPGNAVRRALERARQRGAPAESEAPVNPERSLAAEKAAPTAAPSRALPPVSASPLRDARAGAADLEPAGDVASEAGEAFRPAPEPVPPPARYPARSLGEVLASFLEEKNIRWGELIGGALVLGGSIALVISLWARIEENPLLKFSLFTGVTGTLFAFGLYTEKRWKLPLTSRGFLLLATLLVPLNFLALVAFSEAPTLADVGVLVGEAVATIVFTLLTYLAARVVRSPWPLAVTVGVLAPSLALLAVRRWASPEANALTASSLLAAVLLPPLITAGCVVASAARWRHCGRLKGHASFAATGVAFFAAAVGTAVLVFELSPDGEPLVGSRRAAPFLPLLFAPVLAVGLALHHRLRRDPGGRLPLAATSVTVAAMVFAVLVPLLGWPHTGLSLAASLVAGVVLSVAGRWGRFAAASALALPHWLLAFLLAVGVVRGAIAFELVPWGRFVPSLFSGASGNWLFLAAGLFGAVAGLLSWRGARREALVYAAFAGATLVAAGVLVTVHGYARAGDPLGIRWSFGVAAAVCVLVAARRNVETIAAQVMLAGGLVMSLAALVQHVVFLDGDPDLASVSLAFLLHASGALLVGEWLPSTRVGRLVAERFLLAVLAVALLGGLLVVPLLVPTRPDPSIWFLFSHRAGWLAILSLWALVRTARSSYGALAYCAAAASAAACAFGWVVGAWLPTPPAAPAFPPPHVPVRAVPFALLLLSLFVETSRYVARAAGAPFLAPAKPDAPLPDRAVTVLLAIGVIGACVLETLAALRGFTPATTAAFVLGWSRWLALLAVLLAWSVNEGSNRLLYLASLFGFASGAPFLLEMLPVGWRLGVLAWVFATLHLGGSLLLWARRAVLRACEERAPGLARVVRRDAAWLVPVTRRFVIWVTLSPLLVFAFGAVAGVWSELGGTLDPLVYVVPLLVASGCLFGHGLREGRTVFASFGAVFLHLAVTLIWLLERRLTLGVALLDLPALNGAVLAVSGLGWLVFAGLVPRLAGGAAFPRRYAHAALRGALVLALWTVSLRLIDDGTARALAGSDALAWSAVVLSSVLAVALLRSAVARTALAAVLAAPLFVALLVLDAFDLSARPLLAGVAASLGVHALLLALFGRYFGRPSVLGAADVQADVTRVLLGCAGVLVHVLAAGFLLALGAPARGLPLIVALLPLLPVAALVLAPAPRERRPVLAPVLGATLAVTYVSWSLTEPRMAGVYVRALPGAVSLFACATLTLLAARRFRALERVERLLRHAALTIGAAFVVAFLAFLAAEALRFARYGEVGLSVAGNVPLLVSLAGAAAWCLVFALRPSLDPLGPLERGRTRWVWGAEAVVALGVAHVRLSMPWLFHGFISRYWPLLLLALGYLLSGVGELARRRKRLVLSEPFRATGLLLPAVAVCAFFAIPSSADYAAVLLTAGLLFGIRSALDDSFGLGLLAALLSSGGLWHVLYRSEGLGFFEHPQLWLVPFALAVLAATYWHREQIHPEAMAPLRYVCLLFIYLSSTADVFLAGIGATPWLAVLLAVFSVTGVLVGILARLRSFLFTGATFLVVALVSLIAHASSAFGWTWLWYLAAIVLGMALILLFAVFERRKEQLRRIVDEVRGWGN